MKLIIVFLILVGSLNAIDGFDWGWKKEEILYNGWFEQENKQTRDDNQLYSRLIWIYKNSTTASRTKTCPCFPSCSTFTLYSMRKYGFIQGLIMGIDRIFIRESIQMIQQEVSYYKLVPFEKTFHFLKQGCIYDIPEANNIFNTPEWRYYDPYYYSVFFPINRK